MSEKNKIETIIGGNVYIIQGNEPPEHMHKVASYIDKVTRDVKELDIGNRMSTTQIAMLTSINVANDLMKAREELEKQNLENNGFYNEFNKLEKENEALRNKISELQTEITRLRSKTK